MATSWQIGDRIENRWEIHHILYGGMGIVYIVYDHEFREPFAAKTFRDDIFARNPAIADRFTQEALAWVNLDVHQNVTQARGVQPIGNKPFLFLEYVSGGDLGDWIGTPRLTEDLPQILRFAIHFCDGMTHALAKGIRAHRDIKPQNCLITQNHTLKVTDFGLAKAFDDTSPADCRSGSVGKEVQGLSIGLTRTGTAAGTCTYMAPEQFDDAKHVDVRADVYAFGVMLFQMITGKLPFVGRAWQEFKHLHQTQAPPPLPDSLPPPLIAVVNSCLAKDPARRFADFSAVRERLAELYKSLTGTHAPQPVVGVELDAVGWTNKGASLDNLGRPEEALTCYDHALTLDPHHVQAWYNKGGALGALGRSEEALTCYDHALALDPHHMQAWHNKGASLSALGGSEEALTCYDHALALDPHYAQAWHNKGVVLANSFQRYREALVCFEVAQKLGSPDAAQAIALCRRRLGG